MRKISKENLKKLGHWVRSQLKSSDDRQVVFVAVVWVAFTVLLLVYSAKQPVQESNQGRRTHPMALQGKFQ